MTIITHDPDSRKRKRSFLGQLGLENAEGHHDAPPPPVTVPVPATPVTDREPPALSGSEPATGLPVSATPPSDGRDVPGPALSAPAPSGIGNAVSGGGAVRPGGSAPVYSSWTDPDRQADIPPRRDEDVRPSVVAAAPASGMPKPVATPDADELSAGHDRDTRQRSERHVPHLPSFGAGNAETRDLYEQGLTTLRDLISPPAIKVSPGMFQVGDVYARTLYVVAYPKYLGTNWFSPIINIDSPMDIAFLIHPVDTREIMRELRRSATHVQSQISLESEGGKIRDPMLESALENIEELRDRLQQGTEKFFRFGLYMTVYAGDEKALSDISKSVEAILEAQLVFTKPSILQMDQGFVSTRPLGMDTLDIANNLNTSPLSTTFPFVSSDLSSNDGILYGINRHNNSLVLFDRFKMENANMVVFAKSGAGKSYAIKLEILRSMMFGTTVIVIDPENEYRHLCDTVGGTFVGISLSSDAHINPFDLPRTRGDESEEGLFRSHVASMIGLLHIMLGAMTPEEDSILDRAIRETYAIRDITEHSDFRQLDASSFPTMTDLYEVLRNLEGAESLSARLEQYTEGVYGGFLNHQTNVSTSRQMIVFNIRDLEPELRPIAMYVILQHIWNEIRSEMKQRMIVVDEAWIMMQHEDAAAFMFGIAKRCRKYYAGLTTITQDVGDFMASRYGKPIVTNSSIQLLLRQSPAAVDLIADLFYLTDHEKFLLLESNVGEGIFFAGTKHVAIKIVASYSEDQVITSDPRQLLEIEEAKRDFDAEFGG